MFDKWICKLVNWNEFGEYKHKTVTFGDFLIAVIFSIVPLVVCILIFLISSMTFGLVYGVFTNSEPCPHLLIVGALITCLVILIMYVGSKLWNIEIAKCNK